MRHSVPALFAIMLAACGESHGRLDASSSEDASVPHDAGCSGTGPVCVGTRDGACTSATCLGGERWQCPLGFVPASPGSWECAVDAGVDGGGCPADFGSAEGTPCADEGLFCGGCTDPCGFCNILRCEGGRWTRLEAPPPPGPCVSFACGPTRCDAVTQYCTHAVSDVVGDPDSYRCVAYPEGCASCECLVGDRCEGDPETGITVTYFGG